MKQPLSWEEMRDIAYEDQYLVRLPHFRVCNRPVVLRALELFATVNRDFSDLVIVASMEQTHADALYSYDKSFDRFASSTGITRREPYPYHLALPSPAGIAAATI